MARSAEYSTVLALEQLFDLLNAKPPDPLLALTHVERMLQQATCAQEIRAAGRMAADLVEHLILPVLRHDPNRREQAKALQTHFLQAAEGPGTGNETAGGLAEPDPARRVWAESIEAIRTGMPAYVAPRAEGTLPQTLIERLTTVLHLVGESEERLCETVAHCQSGTEDDWAVLGDLLEQIRHSGHKAATAPWLRTRRASYDTLLRITQSFAATLTLLGRQDTAFAPLLEAVRRFDSRVDLRHFHPLLYAQVMELQKEARSLQAQQEEGRARAEQFRQRVDQLEATLAQARREQFLDPVTGIPDRFAFVAHLHRHLERALHLGEIFSLLLFHFYELKPLIEKISKPGGLLQNDAEKRLLMAVIQEIHPHLPESAFLARLSTERMVILLPQCSVAEGEQMGTVISQILEDICFALDEHQFLLQVSAGCAAFQPGMDVGQMLETTDRLAAAAHSGKEEGQTTARRVRAC
ncbi:MAG: diguanylate cyclase [Magnetococcales bacterium]|nr:diguanylate cyclase [Magnetococcales bacterium]